MWSDVDAFVENNDMLKNTDRIVFGLSGGADSVCLARYLLFLRKRQGLELTAVHVNHMLRGSEGDRDQLFVEDFCRKYDIPLFIFKKDVRRISRENKESLEEAGRRVRYACFREVMDGCGAAKRTRLAVAHHADDLAETVLFRVIRGTGPEGLIGMRPVRGDLIRPLLVLGKEDIYKRLAALGQDYVEDSSNLESDYSRNYIRHHILPDMKKMNPRAADHIYSLSQQLAGLFDHIGPELAGLCDSLIFKTEDGFGIRICDLSGLSAYAGSEVARRLLFLAAGREKDIGNVHVKQLLSLADKADGKQNDFPYGVVAVKKGGCLLLSRKKGIYAESDEKQLDKIPLEISLPEFEEGKRWSIPLDDYRVLDFSYEVFKGQQIPKRDCIKYFDYDTIKAKILCLRTRQSGDYFVLDGKGRHKRLSRYFIDSRIPAEDRDRQLLLAEGSHILWILSGRISWACRITPATSRVLVISIRQIRNVPPSSAGGESLSALIETPSSSGGDSSPISDGITTLI